MKPRSVIKKSTQIQLKIQYRELNIQYKEKKKMNQILEKRIREYLSKSKDD